MDGVLFDGNGTTLLTFPSGRTDGYIVPVNVTGIASSAFANTQITFLDLWSCEPLMIGESIFGEQGGKGKVERDWKCVFRKKIWNGIRMHLRDMMCVFCNS